MNKKLSPSNSCPWPKNDPLYQAYHDDEWGVPCRDDQRLFEFLILEGAQAGLAWITVLRKRDNYNQAFHQFDAQRMANYSEGDIERLMSNPGIIRNRRKIESAIRNARAYLALREEQGSFSDFLWQFVEGKSVQNHWESMADVPAITPEAEAMSKTLKKTGFNFVGPTICYAFMQATGMVNDHLLDCTRHKECKEMAQALEP